MKCPFSHQRAYDNGKPKDATGLWCPDCKRLLSYSESINVMLRLLRRAANIPTSEEQLRLEGNPGKDNG